MLSSPVQVGGNGGKNRLDEQAWMHRETSRKKQASMRIPVKRRSA